MVVMMLDYQPYPETDIGELIDGQYVLTAENQDKVKLSDRVLYSAV